MLTAEEQLTLLLWIQDETESYEVASLIGNTQEEEVAINHFLFILEELTTHGFLVLWDEETEHIMITRREEEEKSREGREL